MRRVVVVVVGEVEEEAGGAAALMELPSRDHANCNRRKKELQEFGDPLLAGASLIPALVTKHSDLTPRFHRLELQTGRTPT